MSNNLKINTEVIRSTAATINSQNMQLQDVLQQSQSTVNSLSGGWTGAAADATIGAYNEFASKYFATYRDMLDQYVKFLNNVAGAGYEETETKVQSYADRMRG